MNARAKPHEPTEEAESLPVHVAACAERYRTLFTRLNRIETIMLWQAATLILGFAGIIGTLIAVAWHLFERLALGGGA